MFRPERDSPGEVSFPLRQRLSRQPEHEVEADVGEISVTKNVKRSLGLGRVVFPAQQLEKLIVPRLHAEAHAVHPEVPKQFCFSERHTAGVRLDGPLAESRQVKALPETRQKELEQLGVQRRGRTSAQENCLRAKQKSFPKIVGLPQQRLAEPPRLRTI